MEHSLSQQAHVGGHARRVGVGDVAASRWVSGRKFEAGDENLEISTRLSQIPEARPKMDHVELLHALI